MIFLPYFVFKWPLLDESIETNFFKNNFVVLWIHFTVRYVTPYTMKFWTVLLTFHACAVLITLQTALLMKGLLTQRKEIHHSDRSLGSSLYSLSFRNATPPPNKQFYHIKRKNEWRHQPHGLKKMLLLVGHSGSRL